MDAGTRWLLAILLAALAIFLDVYWYQGYYMNALAALVRRWWPRWL
jgi:hypothetical protein